MKKERFTNATVFYNCDGEYKHVFCTNRNLTTTLNKMKKCTWITDIEVVKYDFTEDIEEVVEEKEEDKKHVEIKNKTITAIKVDDRLIFTNIWNREMMPKVATITCYENFISLLEFNKHYTMPELYKIAVDNEITYGNILNDIEYLNNYYN